MSGTYRAPVEVRLDEPELGPQRWCAACGEWWPLSREFWYVRRCGRAQCRACLRESTRRWNDRNPDRRRAAWREAARRARTRAAMAAGGGS